MTVRAADRNPDPDRGAADPTADTPYDVVIVGGGLVGASLACALQPTGLRVAMVEAVPFDSDSQPSYDERILAIAQGSKRILTTLGVWGGIEQRGATPIRRIHISDRGHPGFTRLDHRQFDVESLGYVVPARVLGAALTERLQQPPCPTLYCPASVTAIRPGPDRVTLTIDGVHGAEAVTARLAVLADGGRSQTREMVGIGATTRDYAQTVVLTTVTPELPHENVAYERFTEAGPLALLPMTENRYAVVWTARVDEVDALLRLPDPVFLDRLQDRFGDRVGRFRRVGKRSIYPLYLVKVSSPVAERAVVIGNAAHTIHPVAGQGFNLGLRDVAALAEVLYTAARDGEDIGAAGALERYARWRRRDISAVTAFTDGLIRLYANRLPPAVVLRSLFMVGVDILPFAKRFLVRRTMGLAGRLPRLARGLPLG